MFSTINIPVVSVGLGKECEDVNLLSDNWRSEQLSKFLMRDLSTCILDRLCEQKSHQNGDYQLSLNTECNQTKNTTTIFFTQSQVIVVHFCLYNITLFFGVNLH